MYGQLGDVLDFPFPGPFGKIVEALQPIMDFWNVLCDPQKRLLSICPRYCHGVCELTQCHALLCWLLCVSRRFRALGPSECFGLHLAKVAPNVNRHALAVYELPNYGLFVGRQLLVKLLKAGIQSEAATKVTGALSSIAETDRPSCEEIGKAGGVSVLVSLHTASVPAGRGGSERRVGVLRPVFGGSSVQVHFSNPPQKSAAACGSKVW